jgi:hypothetical protein
MAYGQRVVDGETLVLGTGERVQFLGVDMLRAVGSPVVSW